MMGVPFYRLEQKFALEGAGVDRSTMCRYAENIGATLGAIVEAARKVSRSTWIDGNWAVFVQERRWTGDSIAILEQNFRDPSKNVNSPRARTGGRGGSPLEGHGQDRPPRLRTAPRDRRDEIVQ